MIKIEVLKNETYNDNSVLPKTATDRSTGYDIIATSDPEIVGEKHEERNGYKRIDYIQYKTNLKIAVIPKSVNAFSQLINYDVLAFPRSSISKYNLALANSIGLIDTDYRGEILLRFKYIWQPEDYAISGKGSIIGFPNFEKIYKKGDKICQLKITEVIQANFILVDKLDETQRGEGGFGSTDIPQMPAVSDESMSEIIKNYSKNPIYTPKKKYSDLMKERENNL